MPSLSRLFSKYTGFLRSFKPVYYINNLLNRKKLEHNVDLYKSYGLERSIFQSIGSHHFQNAPQTPPWLDRPDAKQALEAHPDYKKLPALWQEQIQQFIERGYMILPSFYSETEVDQLNGVVDDLLEKQKTDFNYTGRKIMDAFRNDELIDQHFFRNKELMRLLGFVMGQKPVPFQTINFIRGSEQRPHSDSIHMSTQPAGYLIAVWTALEDLHQGNGPLVYYPGSHRLPYVTCQDYASGNTNWQLGAQSYKRYEDKIEAVIEEQQLEKTHFLGKKGDVFIWHANLLHGGSPITTEGASRKSMVAHYFCEDVICYHEISQRPALLDLEADDSLTSS